jgi:hypothetical protein
MSQRTAPCRWTLIAFGIVQLLIAVPLLLFLGRAFDWIGWWLFDPTGDKVLGAALASIGVASLLASRDPVRHRIVVQTDILLCFLTAVVLLYRLLIGGGPTIETPTVVWLVLSAVFFALFATFYPPHDAEA